MSRGAFSRQDSLAVKGVAIMMMMWHHCFLEGRFEDYVIDFWPLTQSQVVNVAMFCKICVSLFAFISGYGLFLSYRKREGGTQSVTRWIYERLVRTLSNYWVIVVLLWIVCALLDGRPYRVYGFADSKYAALWGMIVDFFGLSNFFGVGKLGEDWWYISAACIFIILLPVIYAAFEKFGCFCTICIVFMIPRVCGGYPGGVNFLSFVPSFCFGMIFAKFDLFSRWKDFRGEGEGHRARRMVWRVLLCFALLLCYKMYYHLPTSVWWDVKYGIIPLVLILFIYEILFPIPLVGRFLLFAGRHATNIWLIHAFIRSYYCRDFIYGQGHFAVIISVLFLVSLGGSFVIEFLKKIIGFDALTQKLLDFPAGRHAHESC